MKYDIWKEAFDNCNNDKGNEYDLDDEHSTVTSMNTNIIMMEDSRMHVIKTGTSAKRCRLNLSNPEIVTDNCSKSYLFTCIQMGHLVNKCQR